MVITLESLSHLRLIAELNDSQHLTVEDFWGRYYVPSSPENASGSEHASVSPSLIDSDAIKREFGPHSETDQDEHSQMQLPNDPATASSEINVNLAQQVEQIVNSSCLLAFNIAETRPWPHWYRGLSIAFGHHAIVENDNEGPVCYFDTWYADCREASVTEVSRPLRLDSMQNLWQHDIQHLWRDKIQDGVPIYVVWVIPVPPQQPLSRSAGHLIIYQFPNERLVPFLTTIQFVALEVHGTTIACVVGDPSATPVSIVQRLNLDRVCRGRLCTLHRGAISGGIRHTWAMPIVIGENLRLVIPPFGERAHIDILSNPNSVEIVQTGPIPDAFDISMRLEDHSEFTRELHEHWTRSSRRGPAGMEMLLEVTTWYLDAQFVPFNEQSRPVILGEDFFQREQQIREKWADLADASADTTFVFVHPTPPGWPIDHVHVLVLQQFEPGSTEIGGLVAIYDEALGWGVPSTTATLLPRDLNRQRLVDATGRQVLPGHSCSAWLEGFEIRDSTVFQASHGQCFSVHIHRPQLQDWDQPLPEEDDTAHLQLRLESTLPSVFPVEVMSHTKVQKMTAIRLIPAFSFDSGDEILPSFIELADNFGSQDVECELLSFGLQVTAFVIDQKSAALCCPLIPVTREPVGRIVSVNLSPQASQRYQVHYFQQGCTCDDIQLMQILHTAGFAKAVILQQFWHQNDVAEIHFTIPEGTFDAPVGPTRVQKPWPDRQPIVTEAPMFQVHSDEVTQCSLELGVSFEDIRKFFTEVQWPLCDIIHDLDLPECSAIACQTIDRLEQYDRLVIYTDGSSHSGCLHRSTAFIDATSIPDSWAFLVLGEKYGPDDSSSLVLLGWMSHQVRYDQTSSAFLGARSVNPLIAEREALTWAFLWRIFLNTNKPTTFRTDSATTKGQAEGTIGTSECGCYHLLETALPPDALQISHVFGHLNEPWNEFVDHVAKREAHASYYLSWPNIDLNNWKQLIPHLWLIFAQKFGAPKFCGSGFAVPPPALPCIHDPKQFASGEQSMTTQIDFAISLATANVQSLGRSADGFAGKTTYLRNQFAQLNINFLGIQEARSEEGASQVGDILRLCSGASKNNLGVELWCNLSCPLGWLNGKPILAKRSDANVAHRDPRRLLTHFQVDMMPFWILVLHAPQSGQSRAARATWWTETHELLHHIVRCDEPLFVCIDANAAPGPCDHKHVFAKGFETSSSTPFLRDFLDLLDLCLPATSAKHTRERDLDIA